MREESNTRAPITRAEDISFSLWSKLAASMLGMDAAAREARLDAERIDPLAFEEAASRHARDLAHGVSTGAESLADEHDRNLEAALAAPVPTAELAVGDETQLPVMRFHAALPFSKLTPRTAPAASAEFATSSPMRETEIDPSGETLPLGTVAPVFTARAAGASAALPFQQAPEPGPLRLEVFAALVAELRRDPGRRLQVLRAHGIDDEPTFETIAKSWSARFAEDPLLRSRFEALTASTTQRGRQRGER